jgi:predicted nucleic acid-binding protein
MIGIADTGFLVAFCTRRDFYFPWPHALAENIHETLLTCEAVLAETAFHLRNNFLTLRLLNTGLVKLAFEIKDHELELSELAQRYSDRKPDLADLCLVRMSELYPIHPIITVDGDFRFYRRNRSKAISLIMPRDIISSPL